MFVYLDESGDTGFKFLHGSTRYFVISLLLVEDPVPLQAAIENLRADLHFTRGAEFKFSSSSEQVRLAFLRAINPLAFKVRAIVVDKQRITRPHMRQRETFYNYFVRLVLDHDYGAINGATLVLDESFKGKRAKEGLRTYLRRMLNVREENPKLAKIVYHGSHTDYLLQVSDMICGAIYAAHNKGDDRFRQIIGRHIQDEWAFLPY